MDLPLCSNQLLALRDADRSRIANLHGCRARRYELGAKDGNPPFDLCGQAEAALRLSEELHNRSVTSGPRRPLERGGPS